jgi:hypothetical protein
LDGRTVSLDGYRYGFQNQEKDDEVLGLGYSYSAEFWQFDTRIGKRWNRDLVVKHHESPYACYANNPIWFIDVGGGDTTLFIKINATSAIKYRNGVPCFVPLGTKLTSTLSLTIIVKNSKIVGGINGVSFNVEETEYESNVLWGLDPAFTEVQNKTLKIKDGKLYGSYDVVTQLSFFEVIGQWSFGLIMSGIIQDNIITVRQAVSFVYDPKSNEISINYDGSSFPEHEYETLIYSKEKKVGASDKTSTFNKKNQKTTLTQSSYEDAVNSDKFKDRGHKQKVTKKEKM